MADGALAPFMRLISEVPSTRMAGIVALMLLAALTEGIGIMMLVPMLGAVSGESSSAANLLNMLGLTDSLISLLSLFVGLVAARGLLTHAHMISGLRFQHEVVDSLREASFGGLIRSEWRWLSQTRASDHASLLTSNINRVGLGLHQLLALLSKSLAALGCLGAAFLLSWPVALAASLGGIVALFSFKGQRKRSVELGSELGHANRALHAQVQEGLGGVRLTKILGQEQHQQSQIKAALSDLRDKVYRHAVSTSIGRIATQIGGAVLIAILVYCGLVVWKVSLAVLLPVLLVFARLVPMIEAIQQAWNYWLHSAPALKETYGLIDEANSFAEPQGKGPALPLRKMLSVEAVSFAYGGRAEPSLTNISFSLPAFSTTAIMGASGAGKSSLADMIMGLISPDQGRVLVDETEISGPLRQSWRRSVAYVQQDAFLFHDTVRANLLVAKASASDADLSVALKQASANFVFQLPDGLDTVVGDGGVRLSGGERQRIALGRALLGEPQLLILDEATSALDPENEQEVWSAISALQGKVTLLIIGHRLAMLDQADQIIRIDDGQVVAIEHPKMLDMSHA